MPGFRQLAKGCAKFFHPCVTLFAPTPRSSSQFFCPRERVPCVSRAPTRAFFGTRQMRPVTMEGESRLPAASTTSGISTLSTNDLVFHTVLCISWSLLPVKGVDFTFFNVRAKNFTFSHLCYEFKKLVMSTSDNRTELSITVSIFNKTKNNYTRNCLQKSNQEK